MGRRVFLAIAVFSILSAAAPAQTGGSAISSGIEPGDTGAVPEPYLINPEDISEAIVLTGIQVDIEGKTRPGAIQRNLKISEDMVFDSPADLEQKVNQEIQELRNLRVFVEIDYRIEYRRGESGIEATLIIFGKDSWSIFPFVVPQAGRKDSTFQLAVVDKNFLGSLTEAALSGAMSITWDPIDEKYTVSDWETYLLWKGITFNRWQFSSRLSLGYVTERKTDSNDIIIEDLSYYRTVWATDIRFEFRFTDRFYIHLIPTIAGRFNYEVRVDDGDIEYEYLHTGFGLSVDFNRVDWIDFLRQGWSAGLLEYLWWTDTGNAYEFRTAFTARVTGHQIAGPVNPNYRLLGYLSYDHEAAGLGSFIRGVDRHVMYGDRALFLNTGMQFRIFGWDWMDVHLQPFVDMGFAVPKGDSLIWADHFHLGIGTEMLLFFPTLPSLQVRGYFGVDAMVRDWSSENKWQLGLSLSLLY